MLDKKYNKIFDSIKKNVDEGFTKMETFGIRIDDLLEAAKTLNVEIKPEEKESFLEELRKHFYKLGISTYKSVTTRGEDTLGFEKREECAKLFVIVWDSTYKLWNYGEIYRDIFHISSEEAKSIIENKMYNEVLRLLDTLKKFIETCEIGPSYKYEINQIIEEFGGLEYINFVRTSFHLSMILDDIAFPMIKIKKKEGI